MKRLTLMAGAAMACAMMNGGDPAMAQGQKHQSRRHGDLDNYGDGSINSASNGFGDSGGGSGHLFDSGGASSALSMKSQNPLLSGATLGASADITNDTVIGASLAQPASAA